MQMVSWCAPEQWLPEPRPEPAAVLSPLALPSLLCSGHPVSLPFQLPRYFPVLRPLQVSFPLLEAGAWLSVWLVPSYPSGFYFKCQPMEVVSPSRSSIAPSLSLFCPFLCL